MGKMAMRHIERFGEQKDTRDEILRRRLQLQAGGLVPDSEDGLAMESDRSW